MEALNILHLSDLHVGRFRYDDPATLAIKIADTLTDKGRKVDVVIVSGDIFDGRSTSIDEDRKKAIKFFKTLIVQLNSKEISLSQLDENSILFVPGNHDLIRKSGQEYEKYDKFIEELYPLKSSTKIKVIDKYNFICDFPDKKIAILGFNSCRIEIEQVKENELEWVNKSDLSKFKSKESEIKNSIRSFIEGEKKWDDYGYIDPLEMDNVFSTLKSGIPGYHDYTLVATFHHHFYPFPEIVNRYPDASFIRNYTVVIDKFQRFKVQLVLHGHKHLSIQRAITDNKYFENPESIIYVLSAGSIGFKEIFNPSFQWVRVYDKNFPKLADGEKYDYKDEELDNVKAFTLPPQIIEEKAASSQLTDTLQTEEPKLFQLYKDITDDFEQVVQDSKIEKIIEVISSLLTIFNDIKIELRKNPGILYVILLSINYRTIFLRLFHSPATNKLPELMSRIEAALINYLGDSDYSRNLISFLSSPHSVEIDKFYQLIIKNVLATEKKISSYVSISTFFTDLFLNISQYGEYYFEKEKLNHKINIKLGKGLFYDNIPNSSISVETNVDRRAIILNFKSKDPTVHKVAVLIVKDFEMRLNKFEESLKEIRLKLYYISPLVDPIKYDLENFHFDAYIPTLLPLLTGENLYKQKEVFIRELVQNSIDATLLRKKIQNNSTFSTDIEIEFGTEIRVNKLTKYFRITDNGIGMSKFTIERYFTSIGRSFYVSEEFDELQKENKIRYDAISNFGIGFLSSFMVCQEVMVKTKSILAEEGTEALEIEIPNYEGCFFIRKTTRENYGTEITIYEDQREYFDFKKFTEYIKQTLLGLPVTINITNKEEPANSFKIPAFALQSQILLSLQRKSSILFYIPFSEEKGCALEQDWATLKNQTVNEISKFGISLDFTKNLHKRYQNPRNGALTTNQGLRISHSFLPFELKKEEMLPLIKVNYPSSFIQLDVAREKVVKLKNQVNLSEVAVYLEKQISQFLGTTSKNLDQSTLRQINILEVFLRTELGINNNAVKPETFVLKTKFSKDGYVLSIITAKEIPLTFNLHEECYWDLSNDILFSSLLQFFLKNPLHDELHQILSLEIQRKDIKSKLEKWGVAKVMDRFFVERRGLREMVDLIERFEIRGILPRLDNLESFSKKERRDLIEIKRRIDFLESTEHTDLSSALKSADKDLNKLFEGLFLVYHFYRDKRVRPELNVRTTLLSSLLILKIIIFEQVLVKDYKNFQLEIKLLDLKDLYEELESSINAETAGSEITIDEKLNIL